MKNDKIKIIIYFLEKIIILFLIILVNILVQNNSPFLPSVAIIGGADGPTSIYIAGNYNWQSILKYLLSIIFIIGLLILIIFDVIEYLKNLKYAIKYKAKIVFVVVVFTIFLLLIFIGFRILGFLWVSISTLLNIVFSIMFFVKFILLKIIRDSNKRIT